MLKRARVTDGENGQPDTTCKNDWKVCSGVGDAVERSDRHEYVLYANTVHRGC